MFKIILVWILLTFTCWGQHEYSVQNYLHHVKYQYPHHHCHGDECHHQILKEHQFTRFVQFLKFYALQYLNQPAKEAFDTQVDLRQGTTKGLAFGVSLSITKLWERWDCVLAFPLSRILCCSVLLYILLSPNARWPAERRSDWLCCCLLYRRVTSRNSRAVLTVSCWVVCGTDGGRRLLGTKPSTKWTRAGRARRPSSRRRGPMINMDELINQLSATILDDLIDDASLGVIFGVHRSNKLGYLAIEDGFKDNNGEHSEGHPIVIAPNMDVFGQVAIKNKQHECICPSCNRTLAASRFAPHLEKCMGMGRNSSRIASRRIANSSKEGNGNGNIASGTGVSDDDDDADWTFGGSEKKRKRKDKHSTKKKNSRVKNGGAAASTAVSDSAYNSLEGNISSGEQAAPVVNGAPTFESFGAAEKKTLLLQICGVVSEHTGKLCTRTLRCPQHSEEQRRNIRLALLGQNYEHNQVIGTYIKSEPLDSDNVGNVDVDSYEDGDSQAVREALTRGASWDQATEHSSTSSPADSTSTTSSSSKKPTTSKGGKKGKKGSKNSTPPSSIAGSAALEDLYSH